MQKLTINILREYSECYDYRLSNQQLVKVYDELTFIPGAVSGNDILDEFDYIIKH